MAQSGNLPAVRDLLALGADPNAPRTWASPLHAALRVGVGIAFAPAVPLLVKDADPRHRNCDGETPSTSSAPTSTSAWATPPMTPS